MSISEGELHCILIANTISNLTVLVCRIITHADGRRMGRVFSCVCVFVCLSDFPHGISKTDAARITKLDVDMAHHESWKPILQITENCVYANTKKTEKSQWKQQVRQLDSLSKFRHDIDNMSCA